MINLTCYVLEIIGPYNRHVGFITAHRRGYGETDSEWCAPNLLTPPRAVGKQK